MPRSSLLVSPLLPLAYRRPRVGGSLGLFVPRPLLGVSLPLPYSPRPVFWPCLSAAGVAVSCVPGVPHYGTRRCDNLRLLDSLIRLVCRTNAVSVRTSDVLPSLLTFLVCLYSIIFVLSVYLPAKILSVVTFPVYGSSVVAFTSLTLYPKGSSFGTPIQPQIALCEQLSHYANSHLFWVSYGE
ncbi:hypothetical protein UFOVP1328_55 [uncultured Caudovirales phage]|uniref:Uncharacterized protein n=1 Tax=uncultured Caudovirales phage TaxID=2100421 RepID=A0A6J5QK67_9CAUD|nr:hypothetical protein UFOVP1084_23 [uncultured Caudovirales phage]CAB4199545.1 hypothetical protein UFOVP1328_55 [uncultured Caudovirales phage]CAB5228340.1 hypothetical protein UFOVP1532_23 [uncultured Caudovirales phage]